MNTAIAQHASAYAWALDEHSFPLLPDLDAALGQPLLQTLPQITFELGAVDNSDEYTPADNAPFEATVEEIVDGPFEGTEEEQVD